MSQGALPRIGGFSLAAKLRDFFLLTKPRVTLMVLWTALGGAWLAPGPKGLRTIGFLLGTALIVGSANAMNCWLEREIDAKMERTRNRPLAAGRLGAGTALIWALVLGVGALPLLYFFGNGLALGLGLAAWLIYVAIYTPMKRVSPLALFVGAVPGAMPPLMGWTAQGGGLQGGGLVLFSTLFFWQLPHFLAIAVMREEEYRAAGLRIVPTHFGLLRIQSVAWSLALLVTSIVLIPLGLGGPVYACLAFGGGVALLLACAQPLEEGDVERAVKEWGRRVFKVSLLYLPALFGGVGVEAALQRLLLF